ncbi:glutamate receptor ionotropic, delta-2-like isoform X2 [Diorhabda sublineata]|uniref:glutamate receptor ionotropic, delta-2-like isoform X2 n=1 Tax=Diorhabda sublineata TaxID=1163346 RepID=UPI0024E10CB9|nr:glutamate receptor ionotropic, delta-2-like isoform X2 [Diorhabda sublineata]
MDFYLDTVLNVILSTYFINSKCLIIFTDGDNVFNHNLSIPVINVKINNDNIHSEVFLNSFGCQGIVMKSDRPSTVFQTFEMEIRNSTERFNHRQFLIATGTNSTENPMEIFESTQIQYVADLLIVEETTHNNSNDLGEVYELWTHKYTGLQNNSEKVLLDVWYSLNESFSYGANLYPNKLKNQMSRVLKMATFQYEPYTIIGSGKDHMGSEMSSMLTFAKFLNMTPELVINSDDFWGAIYENWTGNGLMGNIVNDKADIGLGSLYTWESAYHYLDLSFPLIRTGVTCLVPAPTVDAGWLTPLYSYSYMLWAFVITTFMLAVFGHAVIYYLEEENLFQAIIEPSRLKYNQSIFVIYKLFVIQALKKSEIPPGRHGVLFIGIMYMFSVFLSNTYSSGLASVMTIPRYYNVIETVEEFVDSGISWAGNHDVWTESISHAKQEPYKTIVDRFVTVPDKRKLEEYAITAKTAFALERLPNDNYAIGTYITRDAIEHLRLMKEDFYWEESVIMTRKSSVLLPKLNEFILRLAETGLISYWQHEAVMMHMDTYIQNVIQYYKTKKQRPVVKLKWNHVAGAFSILVFGCITSMIIIIIEFAIYYMRSKRDTAPHP